MRGRFREDIDDLGNKVIFARMEPGEHFGASYALSETPAMVDVVAKEYSEILFIKRIGSDCGFGRGANRSDE